MKRAESILIGYEQETIPELFRLNPSLGTRPVEKGGRMMDGKIADKSGIEIYEKTIGDKLLEGLPKIAAVAVTTSPFWARYAAGLFHDAYDWNPDEFLRQHLTMRSYGHTDVSGISLDGASSGTMDMGDGKIHLDANQVGYAKIGMSGNENPVHTNPIHVTGDMTGGSGDVTVTGKITGTNVEITPYGSQGELRTESTITLDLKDVNASIKNVNGATSMNIPRIDIDGDGKMEGVKLNVEGGQLQYRGELHGNLTGTVDTDTETDFTDTFRQICLAGGFAEAAYLLRSYIPGTKSRDYKLKTRRELAHYRESMEREQKVQQLIPIGKDYVDNFAGAEIKLKKLPEWVKELAGRDRASKKAARKIIGTAYAGRELDVKHFDQLVAELKELNPSPTPAPRKEPWYSILKGKPKAATPAPARPGAVAPAEPVTPAAEPEAAAPEPAKTPENAPAKATEPPAEPPEAVPENDRPAEPQIAEPQVKTPKHRMKVNVIREQK